MNNALVKELDTDLINKIGYAYGDKEFSFYYDGEKVTLENNEEDFNDEINKQEFVFSFDSQWNPSIHNLIINYSFIINNPNFLFGSNALTHEDNSLGIALLWKSRDSRHTSLKRIGTIDNSTSSQVFNINIDFDPGIFRGTVEFNIVIYLASAYNKSNLLQNNEEGALLGTLEKFLIHLDGDGAEFPMQEFNDKEGPLWKTEIYISDPFMDLFNTDNFCLYINKAHKRYKELGIGKKINFSRLLIEIISSSFEQLIYTLKSNGMLDEILEKESDPGTIANVIKYYFEEYEWDASDTSKLSSTIRESFESRV
ncbi:hypothetical protein [Gracilibacillus alcaliphilus]|uniref:hypothetical protein n=1 Tax=Gracilibacillus alcaliphilus TaxID=1401441 RepID=UPI0019587B3F|nr:hypothetical protein [Gracilibacillus alcaliphilus]MBM7679597.1 hypothetical protein [Gracilibacillus alcaliphilus]